MKKMTGSPLPLGVSEKDGMVNFSVAVESGKTCKLCIYQKSVEEPEFVVELSEAESVGAVRFIALPKSKVKGKEYRYEIDGKCVVDPYVKSISESGDGIRGKILCEEYDWEGDEPLQLPYHEVIAYNLHVRGFTKHASSKVKNKGTFRGVIEKIPYFLELGINQIQCMPVYAFEENPKYHNYWGYGPAFCFAVKEAYAAGKNAEKELKDMVKECHKNGIEVVLHLPFTKETPNQMIEECLRYYVFEYHIDGFILNSYNAPMDTILSDPILKKTKIMQNKDEFQNVMRRFLKGDVEMIPEVMEYLKRNATESGSCNYVTNHTGFTLADLVSYETKHNEMNGEKNQDGPDYNYSCNYGEEGPTRKKHILDLRKRQMRNAMCLMLLAQGTPSILSGDEFGNTQSGNNNVYCQDNEIAWIDWKKAEKEKTFFEYVKRLIALRKEYPVLHSDKQLLGVDKSSCGVPDVSYHGEEAWQIPKQPSSKQLGVYYHGEDGSDCFVAYNMHTEEKLFALPALGKKKEWYRVFSTADEQGTTEEMLEKNQKGTMVEGRTIVMFVGK